MINGDTRARNLVCMDTHTHTQMDAGKEEGEANNETRGETHVRVFEFARVCEHVCRWIVGRCISRSVRI